MRLFLLFIVRKSAYDEKDVKNVADAAHKRGCITTGVPDAIFEHGHTS
jgi:hypothetical protein